MDQVALLGVLATTAIAVAVSPLPITAVVLLLLARRGRVSAVWFAVGWVAGVLVGVLVTALVADALPDPDARGRDPVVGWITVIAGVLLLAVAAWQWTHRRLADGRPATVRWFAVVDDVGPRRAAVLGLLAVVANPKNLVLSLSAGITLGEAAATTAPVGIVLAVVAYVLVGALGVVLPVVAVAVAPSGTARPLAAVREWLLRRGIMLLVVVLVVLGVVEVVGGLRQL
ncbi:GAP family protein [Curtobacterium sp. RRHDQ10]|uniref:GAP family protein n=1 Tax=Curtobacterium phyllosphaerae TaxID=3413379 RepID=UPI003BF40B95